MSETPWVLYVLRCGDGSLYTGITNKLERRVSVHNSGKGAKYTRSRLPVVLETFWVYSNRSSASKAEYKFKRLPRSEKLRLLNASVLDF